MEIRPLLSALWRNRTAPLLVALQIAITLAVLVNITYWLQRQYQHDTKPTGMDIENIFYITTEGYGDDYNQATTVTQDLAYLNALPGVVAATASHRIPQADGITTLPFSHDPNVTGYGSDGRIGLVYSTTTQVIEALGLTLIAGRSLSAEAVQAVTKDSSTPWASEVLVTAAFADKIFPKGDALGKTVYAGLINKSAKIVGIVEHLQWHLWSGPWSFMSEQIVFVPSMPSGKTAQYLVRTRPGRRDELMARIEKEFEQREPKRYVPNMETMAKTVTNARRESRTNSVVIGIVAGFVVAVTALGIFGLAAFNVTTRTKQIGTRRALGARRFHILRYFLVENWMITTLGVSLGSALALGVGIKISLMYQMPRLPLYYLVGGIIMLWLLGLAATFIPARRAAAISPAIATRTV